MPYDEKHQRGRQPVSASTAMPVVGHDEAGGAAAAAAAASEPEVAPASQAHAFRKFEHENVHKVYDVIAGHFSSTRYKPWPRVAEFLGGLPDHSVVADVGCGNGKYLGVNKNICTMGSDMCENLVKICRDNGHEGLVCDGMFLPYRSGTFDAAISIAVIHHFATPANRRSAVEEMARVLRPGGRCLIYVWAWVDGKHEDQDLFVPWTFQKRFQTDDMSAEILTERGGVEDDKGDVIFNRYYHMFKQGELAGIVASVPGMRVEDEYFDHENWAVVAVKE